MALADMDWPLEKTVKMNFALLELYVDRPPLWCIRIAERKIDRFIFTVI